MFWIYYKKNYRKKYFSVIKILLIGYQVGKTIGLFWPKVLKSGQIDYTSNQFKESNNKFRKKREGREGRGFFN